MTREFDEGQLLALIADELCVDRERVIPEARFFEDLEADSLGAAELMMKIEDRYEIEIPNEPERFPTVASVLDYARAAVELQAVDSPERCSAGI